jgi:aspartate aminotransferase
MEIDIYYLNKTFKKLTINAIIIPHYLRIMVLSDRSKTIPIPATRKLTPYALAAKEQGVNVIHLNIGDPDLPTPKELLSVLHDWENGPIGYTNSNGNPELIGSLLKYYQELGFDYLKKQDIIVTIGGSEALDMFFYSVCNHGDEVLVFEPFYSNYVTLAYLNGVKLVGIPTELKKGFHLPDSKEIEKHITKNTKAILFSNPGNPSGTIYTKAEIKILVDISMKHDLLLVADEVYREFNFTQREHASVLEFMPEAPHNILLIDSLSKRYSLCGARVGNIVTLDQELIKTIAKIAQSRLSGDAIGQKVAAALTNVPKKYHQDLKEIYLARRDLVYNTLKEIPGVSVSIPEGAFYVMAALPVKNAEDFCIWLLQEFRDNNETVMFAPGEGFYITKAKGRQEIRIAYVLDKAKLQRALEILAKALQVYQD